MSNVPPPSLPRGQAARLAVLLDALDGMVISNEERTSLAWLPGSRRTPVANTAIVITETVGDSDITPRPHSDRFSTE